MPKILHIISGLGADERVFQKIKFHGYEVKFIKWIAPQAKETIEHYASRLKDQITGSRPIIIGLSFGGIMAMELAKQLETEKVILIASVKTRQEIPYYLRWAGKFRLHRLAPAALLKQYTFLSPWFFGASTREDKTLLKSILRDTDPLFLKWAIDKILNWQNQTLPPNLLHIHGTADRILPIRYVECDKMIEGGGHFMTLDRAEEVEEVVMGFIKKE